MQRILENGFKMAITMVTSIYIICFSCVKCGLSSSLEKKNLTDKKGHLYFCNLSPKVQSMMHVTRVSNIIIGD